MSDCDKGFEESWKLIKTTIEEEGPFDGIMGFSQGAAFAALICMKMPQVNFKNFLIQPTITTPLSEIATIQEL